VLCLKDRGGHPRVTRLVGREDDDVCSVVFGDVPPAEAEKILAKLLHLYWLGQTAPLPFFPNSARAYVNALGRGKSETEAIEKSARYQFDGGTHAEMDESSDANVRLVFAGVDPLTVEGGDDVPTFGELAEEIFGDLDRYRTSE
jgi:exonuclease V gamma subunit